MFRPRIVVVVLCLALSSVATGGVAQDVYFLRTRVATGALVTARGAVHDNANGWAQIVPTFTGSGLQEGTWTMNAGLNEMANSGSSYVSLITQAGVTFNPSGQSVSNFSGISQHTVGGEIGLAGGLAIAGVTKNYVQAEADHIIATTPAFSGSCTCAGADIDVGYMALAGALGASVNWGYTMWSNWDVVLGGEWMSVRASSTGSTVLFGDGSAVFIPSQQDAGNVHAGLSTTVCDGDQALIFGQAGNDGVMSGPYHTDEFLTAVGPGQQGQVTVLMGGAQATIVVSLGLTTPPNGGCSTTYLAY